MKECLRDTVGVHLSSSMDASAEMSRLIGSLDTLLHDPILSEDNKNVLSQKVIKAISFLQGKSAGHAFRAAELAYDLGYHTKKV